MRAWLLDDFGGLGKLRVADVAAPVPSSGEAVVEIDYAGLNPADRFLSEGQYPAHPPLPHILGRDGVGMVTAVGPGVGRFKVGDRVIVLRSEIGVSRSGTFAEQVAVSVASLAPIPAGWSDQQAGGAALVYLTAFQALTQWGSLPPSVVLVTGASGGVGVATLQMATANGHRVIALSRSEEKRERLRELGAFLCVDPEEKDWVVKLKKTLGEVRVDLVIDNVAGPLFNEVLGTLGNNGKVSVIGRANGPVPQFNTGSLFFRRIKIGGVAVGGFTPAESQSAWKEIVETLDRAGAKPLIDSLFGFDQLIDAFEQLKKGPMGKVLLSIKQ